MYIIDGIAYAGEREPILKVTGIRPLDDFKLWVRFNDDITKIFDFKPLLSCPGYMPLADVDVFRSVYIDYGTPVWNDGDIDIAPEYLYEHGIEASDISAA